MIGVGSALISLFLVLVCYSLTLTAKRADENLLMVWGFPRNVIIW